MEPPSTSSVSILNESGRGFDTSPICIAVETALKRQGSQNQIVCVLLASDEVVQALNAQHRGVDEPTDVLTFPAGEFPNAPLGDIAIAVPYAERQAAARGATLEQELCYLAIHGALHLCGFEDDDDVSRAQMVAEMNRTAVAAGLPPDEDWYSLLHHASRKTG